MNDTDDNVEIGIFYLEIIWLQAEVTLLEQKPNSLAFQTLLI